MFRINYIITKYTNNTINFIRTESFDILDENNKKFYVKKYNFMSILFFISILSSLYLTGLLYDNTMDKYIMYNIILIIKCYLNSENLINID